MIFRIITIIILLITCTILIINNNNKEDENTFISLKNTYDNIISDIPIFIINLEKNSDRKDHMINLMNKLNFINYKFIIPVSIDEATSLRKNYNNMDVKALSLKLTNLQILKHCIDNKIENFVIAEDDIDIYTDNINYLSEYLTEINKHNPDLIFFDFCGQTSITTKKLYTKNKKEYYKLFHPACLGFTIYNINAAKKILNLNFNTNIIHDVQIGLYTMINKLNCYGIKIFKQNHINFGSNLDNERKFDKYFIF